MRVVSSCTCATAVYLVLEKKNEREKRGVCVRERLGRQVCVAVGVLGEVCVCACVCVHNVCVCDTHTHTHTNT
jgi:hypothetical protein